jgi:hypothetical protein
MQASYIVIGELMLPTLCNIRFCSSALPPKDLQNKFQSALFAVVQALAAAASSFNVLPLHTFCMQHHFCCGSWESLMLMP